MNATRVTIPDLANELGLSVGTVSNALNGHGRVAPATRERVLEAARERGYSRNRIAAALRSGRNGVVSVHLPTATTDFTFYMEFTFGLSSALAEHGVDLLIAAPDGANSERLVDGTIVVDWSGAPDVGAALESPQVPILAVEGVVDGSLEPTMTIAVDYTGLTHQIVDGALASGATRVSLVTCEQGLYSDTAWLRGVVEGYSAACAAAGIAVDRHVFPTDESPTLLGSLLDEMRASSGSDGIVFASQRIAGLAYAMRGYGHPDSPVPWIASSVGDPISELSNDAITAIDPSADTYGRRCGELILELVADPDVPPSASSVEWPARIKWAEHWTPEVPLAR